MDIQLIVPFILIINNVVIGTDYAYPLENIPSSAEKRETLNSKIHPILIQWQKSDNQDSFAKNYNLPYGDGKIGIYIYLNSTEFESKIPSEIQITASHENIVAAFVTSEQLKELSEFDFVERITLPDLARTLPMPQIDIPKEDTITNENAISFIWLVIGGIAVVTIIVVLRRKYN